MEAGHACCAPRLHSSLLLDAREVAGATPAVDGLQPEEGDELVARGEVPSHELQLALVVVGEGLAVGRLRGVAPLAVRERDEEPAVLHGEAELAAHLDECPPILVRPVPDPHAVVVHALVADTVVPDVDVAEDPHPLVPAVVTERIGQLVRLRLLDEGREHARLARADGHDPVVLAALQIAVLTHLYPPSLGQLPDSVRVTFQRSAPQFLCRALSDNRH